MFFPDEAVKRAGLDLAPVGASTRPAPTDLLGTILTLTVLLLDDHQDGSELPALDALLDHVGTEFEPAEHGAPKEALMAARRRIEAGHMDSTPLGHLANELGMSGPELSRSFAATWGVTPVHYRKQLRLRAATQALANGMSVTDAAGAAGFSDAAHLSRTFQSQYGISPSAWQTRIARARPA